ncbi:hypothetical protein [Streptomyces sp. NPDC050738]|uniref:ATP-grasp domain-containing protein n=1 Tax=Streptomyces sp. NPDC050738 TaxID=3154744 RepID=UPI00341F2BFA
MSGPRIAVITFTDDLHALLVRDRLREQYPGTRCEIVETDTLADTRPGPSWSTDPGHFPHTVPVRGNGTVDPASLDLIWHRRWNRPQRAADALADPAVQETVNAATSSALLGTLYAGFRGTWVSDPEATRRAENKILQLEAARTAGLAVPATLISQDPPAIRKFHEDHAASGIVLKALRSTPRSQLFTLPVTQEMLADDEALRLCPSIFQQYVPGSVHIRALCLDTEVHAVTVDSPELDWRRNLDVPVHHGDLPPHVRRALARVLELLGLRMGVADLKIDQSTGEAVWLELNPQGQFLFVEGLTGIDLTGIFAAFLHREAVQAQHRKPDTAPLATMPLW